MLDEEGVAKTRQRFEERGEELVQQDLAQGLYGEHSSEKVRLANLWLSGKVEEREKADRADEVDREEWLVALAGEANALASKANTHARKANTHAHKANTRATWSNWISVAAAIFAGLALLKSFGVI